MNLRCLIIVCGILSSSSAFAQTSPPLRIITCGWNAPTIGQFARDVNKMPGDLPITGSVLTLHSDSGKPDPMATAHDTSDWSVLDVERSIREMAAVAKDRLPDNYLLLKANPGDVDWFDDQGWNAIVEHYRIAARIARRAGLRGLLIDFEPYTTPYRQFQYSRQSGAIDHSFDQYQVAARDRGREVMRAIESEFPSAEVCTFFLLSYLIDDHHYRGPSPVGRGDARWCLAGHSYGLLPAFVDGWLDVIPPEISIIDGCENGYWFRTAEQFQQCADGVRRRGAQLVSNENRQKYQRQIRVAFPIYLDAIHPTFAGRYTLQPERDDRLALLKRNLSAAISSSGRFVWLYGEHGRWWPEAGDEALWNGKDVYPTWETNMPGISDVLKSTAATAVAKGDKKVDANGKAKQDSETETPKQPTDGVINATEVKTQPEWEAIQNEPAGEVKLNARQVTITGAEDASGLATIQVEPGRRYMIQVQVVQEGRGLAKLSLRWKRPDGRWRSERDLDVTAYPPDGDPTKPRTITAIVTSPADPHQLVIICNASRQLTKDDGALFGNLMVGLVD